MGWIGVMNSRQPAIVIPLASLAGMLAASPARAADRQCARMAVEADAGTLAQWPGLPDRVRGSFEARADVDACARVRLTRHRSSIAVEVLLPDGRAASRSVSRPEDVVPTLEALLLVPELPPPAAAPPEPPAESPASAAPAPAPMPMPTPATSAPEVSAGVRPAAVADRHAATGSPAVPASPVRVELSVVTEARVGDGRAGGGLGALAFLDVAGWLAGLGGRVDAYQGVANGQPTGAFELALLGGRRLRSGTLALDLVAGVALALQGTTKSVTQAGSNAPAITTSTSRVAPRLLVGARLNFRARSTLRTFVGLEGELGAGHADDNPSSDLPPLPAWTVGLAFGVTVGTR
jgi:hypothetical protein